MRPLLYVLWSPFKFLVLGVILALILIDRSGFVAELFPQTPRDDVLGLCAFGAIALAGFPAAWFVITLYLLPSIAAIGLRHPQGHAVVAFNVLLGWTVIGWALALVWSMTAAGPVEIATPAQAPAETAERPDDDLIGNRFLSWLGTKVGGLLSTQK